MIYRRHEGDVIRRNRIGWGHDKWTRICLVWKFGRYTGYFRWRNMREFNPGTQQFLWSFDVNKEEVQFVKNS